MDNLVKKASICMFNYVFPAQQVVFFKYLAVMRINRFLVQYFECLFVQRLQWFLKQLYWYVTRTLNSRSCEREPQNLGTVWGSVISQSGILPGDRSPTLSLLYLCPDNSTSSQTRQLTCHSPSSSHHPFHINSLLLPSLRPNPKPRPTPYPYTLPLRLRVRAEGPPH